MHELLLITGKILDNMLAMPRWSRLAEVWGESDREELTMIWHNLDGTEFL